MLLAIAILLMAGLSAANYRVGQSLLYPAALLTSAWTAFFVLLLTAGSIFYPVSAETLIVYLVGAGAFSAGAIVTSSFFPQACPVSPVSTGRRPGSLILTGGLILLVVTLPFYWGFIQSLASYSGGEDFWFSVRVESIDRADDWSAKSIAALLTEGVAVLAALLAITAVAGENRTRLSRIRTMTIVGLALLYALMQAASSGAVTLVLGLIGVDAIRHRRLKKKLLVIGLVVVIASFSIVSVLLSKGKTSIDAPASDNLSGVAELLGVYMLGGVVGFDTVVQYPASVPPVWSIWRVFLLTANKFGAGFDVPSLHAQFTDISNDYEGNVYTIYFAYYPDYGLVGVLIIMLLLGGALTFIYQKAIRGNPHAIFLYAPVFSGILLSGFSEYFFLNVNFWFKAILYTLAIYGIQTRPAPSLALAEPRRRGLPERNRTIARTSEQHDVSRPSISA